VVDVPEHTEGMLDRAIKESYGRGFRRCFEVMRKTPALYVLFGAGAYDEVRGLLRDKVFHQMGPEAVTGWDSVDLDPQQK
jgi:hypothetical protein